MPAMPEIIAHRGLPRERTENTIESFALALERRADAVELDVHATRDGVVVVHHDPALGAPNAHVIATTDWAELADVELAGGGRVPRLADVLALCAAATTYVEVKGRGIEALVAAELAKAPGGVAVHAFDHRVPAHFAADAPNVPRGILLSSYLVDTAHALRGAGARDLWQHAAFIDAALVATAHEAGARVVAWTVNDADDAVRLASLGVGAICTDHCDTTRAALERAGFTTG